MAVNPYALPVKRLGNERNPKLVILLSNPGGDPKWPYRLPEYTMDLHGEYKDARMSLIKCREYNDWWDDFFRIFEKHDINPADVLLLEFYPYHTVSSGDFNSDSRKWNRYACVALDENITILRRCLARNIPVFGYYYGCWLRTIPKLKEYRRFYKSRGRWKSQKIKEFDNFLVKIVKVVSDSSTCDKFKYKNVLWLCDSE